MHRHLSTGMYPFPDVTGTPIRGLEVQVFVHSCASAGIVMPAIICSAVFPPPIAGVVMPATICSAVSTMLSPVYNWALIFGLRLGLEGWPRASRQTDPPCAAWPGRLAVGHPERQTLLVRLGLEGWPRGIQTNGPSLRAVLEPGELLLGGARRVLRTLRMLCCAGPPSLCVVLETMGACS
jgi:hypothetical protein